MPCYLAMKDLAVICGSTQQRIGRALAKLGLWIINGRPTPKAYAEGYIDRRQYPNRPDIGDRSLAIWHTEKTLAALKTIGVTPLPEFVAPPPAPKYRARPSYMDRHDDWE
jgi:hypothetical protein